MSEPVASVAKTIERITFAPIQTARAQEKVELIESEVAHLERWIANSLRAAAQIELALAGQEGRGAGRDPELEAQVATIEQQIAARRFRLEALHLAREDAVVDLRQVQHLQDATLTHELRGALMVLRDRREAAMAQGLAACRTFVQALGDLAVEQRSYSAALRKAPADAGGLLAIVDADPMESFVLDLALESSASWPLWRRRAEHLNVGKG